MAREGWKVIAISGRVTSISVDIINKCILHVSNLIIINISSVIVSMI